MPLIPQVDELLELRHRAHVLGLGTHHKVDSVLSGLYASVFRGQGMDFEEAREYQEGDEIRNMDWRVTARTGVPHLKVFREERERPVVLAVDIGPHMQFGTRGTFKSIQAARAAALLGWSASGNQDRVGSLLFGDAQLGLQFFRPSRARRSMWRMLQTLSRVAENGPRPEGDPLLEALEKLNRASPTGSLIFLIADLNRDPGRLEQQLGRLRQRHEIVLLSVDDPADREIPDIGRVVFEAPDGSRVEIDTSSETGRRHYLETWMQNRQALETLTNRLALTLIPLSTQNDIHKTLVDGLMKRRKLQVIR